LPGAIETEVKLRVASVPAAREALSRLGATLVTARHLEDNLLFDSPGGTLAGKGRVLRLRRTPAAAFLTFKEARRGGKGIKRREEIELTVDRPDALQAILERLGFRVGFRYQKYREAYAWKGLEIVVDETPIGAFLEIEGDTEGIHAAARALGYGPSDYISESYVALFFAAGGTGDMVFP
jgi:adenylate cyclase class 2